MTTAASAAAIPFRAEPAIGGGQVAEILLVAIGLLAATFLLLAYARRKGWLDRWIGNGGAAPSRRAGWRVESQRISRQTTVHTLSRDGRTFVVVESGVSIALAGGAGTPATQEIDDEAA